MKCRHVFSLFLALFVASSLGSKHLLAIKGFPQSSIPSLIERGLDVRGSYGVNPGFALLFADPLDLSLAEGVSFLSLGLISEQEMVTIIESNGKASSAWVESVSSCNSFGRVTCFEDACVAVYQSDKAPPFLSCLPSDSELVSLPPSPVSLPASDSSVAFPPSVKSEVVSALVSKVSTATILDSLVQLTNIFTRQSQSTGAVEASNFLASTYQRYGWNVTRQNFRSGFSENIIAQRTGAVDPSKIVIIGAHYDSRAANVNSPTDRAPGANDDASGTAGLIEIARIIGESGLNIPYTVRLASFGGEEQGLVGSTFYAEQQSQAGANIVAMLQGDMIGYQTGNTFGMYFSTRSTTPALITALDAISKQYVPNLNVGRSTGCCSDQQPFFNLGYPAALYLEGTSDPQYHTVGDVVNRSGYSVQLIAYITQSILAGAATYAQVQ